MTNEILLINGNVKFSITLDPSVWIFDDRKVDLCTYFNEPRLELDQLEQYTKSTAEHWDREIREGAAFPPIRRSVTKFEKEKMITGTFAIPLRPFLQNAEVNEGAHSVEIHTETNVYTITLQDAMQAILGFSKDGKPLREDGPVHLYFGDGSNVSNPIVQIRQFTVV